MQCRCLHLIIVMLNFGLGVRQQQLTRWFIIKPKPVDVLHQPFTILKLLLNNHNQIHRQSTATAQHSDTRFITGGGQDVLDLDLFIMYIQVVSIIKMSMLTTNIITRDSHVNAHSWHIYHGLKIFAIGSSEANKIPRLNFRPIVNLGIYFQVSW